MECIYTKIVKYWVSKCINYTDDSLISTLQGN